VFRFNSRIRRFPQIRTSSPDSGESVFSVAWLRAAASGGIGDGFGIGASNRSRASTCVDDKLWRDTPEANAGGMGDGFGMGASKRSALPVRDDCQSCSGEIGAEAWGGTGEGFGIGASSPVRPNFDRDSEFAINLFRLPGVLMRKLLEEYDVTAPCEFIPKTVNASVITDKFRLISC
jgi:hypothetical protein